MGVVGEAAEEGLVVGVGGDMDERNVGVVVEVDGGGSAFGC